MMAAAQQAAGPRGDAHGSGDRGGGGQQQSGEVLWPGRRRRPRAATPHHVPARVRGSCAALLDLRVAEARLHQPHGHALTYTPPPSCQRGVCLCPRSLQCAPGPEEPSLPNTEPRTTSGSVRTPLYPPGACSASRGTRVTIATISARGSCWLQTLLFKNATF